MERKTERLTKRERQRERQRKRDRDREIVPHIDFEKISFRGIDKVDL